MSIFLLSTPFAYAQTPPPDANKGLQDAIKSQLQTNFGGNSTTNNASVNTTGAPRAIIVNEGTYLPANLQNSQALPGQTSQFGIGGAAGSFGSCIAGSAVTAAVKNAITNVIETTLTNPFQVPIKDPENTGKEVGSVSTLGLSWDQLGWCSANALIEAIGDATVNWINSGFNGNPAFVEDPSQFFSDIADVQAAVFLNEISGGLFCTPIKDIVRINLAQNYNAQIAPYGGQCSFSAVSGSLEQFMGGETFSWQDWTSYTQNSQNNPFAATIGGSIELNNRIAASLGVESKLLDWSAGFLSKKDPQTGKITSPGSLLQEQINTKLGSGQRRLEIADEFDEIVNALVNQLITIALSEATQAGN